MSSLVIPDLAGKIVLITGGSSGIGAALVEAYAAQGCKVGLHYNSNKAAAEEVAAKAGGEVFLVQGNFSKSEDVRRVVEETATHFGGLNGLVNNAGDLVARISFEDMPEEHYDRVMNLNARSVVFASQAAIPYLKKDGGFILSTSSVAARNGGGAGSGMYGSSKAFVSNIMRGMAKEFVSFGIRVNVVAPGLILTPLHERNSTPEQMKAMVAGIPMGRGATAEECVGAYLFLSSPMLSGYITGQVIEVNGGIM
jgi:3-oxoacyl-[acyl-carrier protein] reductase